jgi:hypothetical protein
MNYAVCFKYKFLNTLGRGRFEIINALRAGFNGVAATPSVGIQEG